MVTDVRYFHSEMADAPVLSGTPGALIALIDACRNGFCVRALDSLTVTDGVATAMLSAGNPYEFPAVINLTGAGVPALNADWRIKSSAADRFTFDCPGVPNGPVSGTIVVKRSGMTGWAKPFSDGNRAVYQSSDLTSTQLYLYVDDTPAQVAQVRGAEQVVDIDTLDGLFPTAASQVNYVWSKSNASNVTMRRWVILSDSSFVHVLVNFNGDSNWGYVHDWFGDMRTYSSGDEYACMINAGFSTSGANPNNRHEFPLLNSNFMYTARQLSGIGGAQISHLSGAFLDTPSSAICYVTSAAPNSDAGGYSHVLGPLFVRNGTGAAAQIRGELPGVRQLMHTAPFTEFEPIDVDGNIYLPISIFAGLTGQRKGQLLFNISGNWR